MSTSDEVTFAWALTTEAHELFTPRERAWICITLGAGDSTRVVEHLLNAIAKHELTLTDDLVDSAFDWFVGFMGTDKEPRLRALVKSLRSPPLTPPQTSADWLPRAQRVVRRVPRTR
ncbi:hypothetical protein [Mycobacterium sp. E1747]|uniref:hypothetical protein n=1 Tax=Mycobacterium sp. E1747 TaxID=1834128 RepID=UPI0007FC467C|nr:hypothetical protein [Mycobacterium sp. E1747]OBH11133.1 hypothetical protein A5695_20210 [Mycobacterium sp. E1747]